MRLKPRTFHQGASTTASGLRMESLRPRTSMKGTCLWCSAWCSLAARGYLAPAEDRKSLAPNPVHQVLRAPAKLASPLPNEPQ